MKKTYCDLCHREVTWSHPDSIGDKCIVRAKAVSLKDDIAKVDICPNCLRKEVASAFGLSLREPVMDDDFIRHHLWEMFTACKSSQLDTVISICQMLEHHLRESDGEKRMEGPLEPLNL